MRLDLYAAETARNVALQAGLLDAARERLLAGEALSPLERNGVLHAIQVLVENAIGKAKQLLKAAGEPVPVSAYDAFADLARRRMIGEETLPQWNAAVGLRNRIVHEYLSLDPDIVLETLRRRHYRFVADFLLAPIPSTPESPDAPSR